MKQCGASLCLYVRVKPTIDFQHIKTHKKNETTGIEPSEAAQTRL